MGGPLEGSGAKLSRRFMVEELFVSVSRRLGARFANRIYLELLLVMTLFFFFKSVEMGGDSILWSEEVT